MCVCVCVCVKKKGKSIVLSRNNASGVRLLAVDYNQAEKEEMRNR